MTAVKINVKKADADASLIEIQGDLDFHSSPDLRKELTKLIDRKAPKVLIDLKKVNYIDSSGLATFVELFQKMKQYNGKLALFDLAPSVRSVFEIAKLDTIFKLAQSEQEAVSLVSA